MPELFLFPALRNGLLYSNPLGSSAASSNPSCVGVRGRSSSPPSLCTVLPRIPFDVTARSDCCVAVACSSSSSCSSTVLRVTSSDCFVPRIGDARTSGATEEGTSVAGEDCLPGVLDFLRGAACRPSPRGCEFLRGDAVEVLSRAATLLSRLPGGVVVRNATGFRLLEGVVEPSGLRVSRLCAPLPADFGRGRRLGLNRARLAFVGDKKDARLGVVCIPSRVTGCSRGGDALIGTEAVVDTLRRFDGELSIAHSACYMPALRLQRNRSLMKRDATELSPKPRDMHDCQAFQPYPSNPSLNLPKAKSMPAPVIVSIILLACLGGMAKFILYALTYHRRNRQIKPLA